MRSRIFLACNKNTTKISEENENDIFDQLIIYLISYLKGSDKAATLTLSQRLKHHLKLKVIQSYFCPRLDNACQTK